jgi:alpha-beta hydrolase superfamily lysophospholipase
MTGNATPVAVIAAAEDRVVKPRRTKALLDQVDNLVFEATLQGAGHETLYQLPAYETTLQAAFGALRAAAPAASDEPARRPMSAAMRLHQERQG